jgi:hypothetical protein
MHDSTPDGYCHRLSSIIGAELADHVFEVNFKGFL